MSFKRVHCTRNLNLHWLYTKESYYVGVMAVTALKMERNTVAILENDECCASVFGKLTLVAS